MTRGGTRRGGQRTADNEGRECGAIQKPTGPTARVRITRTAVRRSQARTPPESAHARPAGVSPRPARRSQPPPGRPEPAPARLAGAAAAGAGSHPRPAPLLTPAGWPRSSNTPRRISSSTTSLPAAFTSSVR